jgi:hypothetical protein
LSAFLKATDARKAMAMDLLRAASAASASAYRR